MGSTLEDNLPVFFPDATRGFVKSVDTSDIESSGIKGVLVNTYHLWREIGEEGIKKIGGIKKFMDFKGIAISDSGGFQVMSVIKSGKVKGKISDEGVTIYSSKGRKVLFSPELSIRFQMLLGVDMAVALDDFTPPDATYSEAEKTVKRTIDWAKRCKTELLKYKKRPYLLGVVQGGKYQDLRLECAKSLVDIGFDGLGYGGWPIGDNGDFDLDSAKTIASVAPKNYFLFGLGIGKPEDIVACSKLGFNIFDCVLPSRDARHGRLYVFNSDSIKNINIENKNFYSFYNPDKEKYLGDMSPVSLACDCLLCRRYTKAYLAHLFKSGDFNAGRLSTIHNLRFYSILMDKIRNHSI